MVIIVRKDRLFRADNLVRVINENQNIVLMLIAADAVLFLVGIFIYSDIYYYERDFFFYQQSVYADGLTQENLPPASLGDSSGGPLNADVIYDLVILDDNGTQVAKKEALLAENSTDTQSLSFPAGGRYQLELYVNGLLLEDQDTPDLTRNGVTRGYVIVSSNNI